ncbi:PREDICTED: probable cysteine protease RDL6 [Tarenaya hassleriana]|uniref:probable cysteine protease RDL6 n=1 Tax=Tarenaya hassleriana TaxID=28532 RepID=UPI00053C75AD|nr:PREDICTED: probable cysteine protease RDL6 [Tarenaya hassleriana]
MQMIGKHARVRRDFSRATGQNTGGPKRAKDKNHKKNEEKDEKVAPPPHLMPRNPAYLESEKAKPVKVPAEPDEDEGLPVHWDWRNYQGIISNVLDQGLEAICWSITYVRAIEALFNINRPTAEQKSFSIQHLVNRVNYGKTGVKEVESALSCLKNKGVVHEADCSYRGFSSVCPHDENVRTETIDDFVVISKVDDVILQRLVRRSPVVGSIAMSWDRKKRSIGIFRGDKNEKNLHAVLIIGYGIDENGQLYWLVQSSWGTTWADNGFGRIERKKNATDQSLFAEIYYPVKAGYPQKPKKRRN